MPPDLAVSGKVEKGKSGEVEEVEEVQEVEKGMKGNARGEKWESGTSLPICESRGTDEGPA